MSNPQSLKMPFSEAVKQYLQLFRIHHWIKNVLIFIPLFFKVDLFNASYILLLSAVSGFVCFSILSSIVYVLNDIRDIEKDRRHSTKCRRPLASGAIPVGHAIIALIMLSLILIVLLVWVNLRGNPLYDFKALGLLALYMLLNVGYSWGLKNIPIVDVSILALGYVIRVLFGALIIGVTISVWLYLVITMGAYYLGLGKRRNEITNNEKETRGVMRFYSHNFLDKNMYLCQALCVVFYALWSIDSVTLLNTSAFIYTIPLILVILLKYSLNIETNSDGDPTSVLLHDKVLMLLCALYVICAFSILYMNRGIV